MLKEGSKVYDKINKCIAVIRSAVKEAGLKNKKMFYFLEDLSGSKLWSSENPFFCENEIEEVKIIVEEVKSPYTDSSFFVSYNHKGFSMPLTLLSFETKETAYYEGLKLYLKRKLFEESNLLHVSNL